MQSNFQNCTAAEQPGCVVSILRELEQSLISKLRRYEAHQGPRHTVFVESRSHHNFCPAAIRLIRAAAIGLDGPTCSTAWPGLIISHTRERSLRISIISGQRANRVLWQGCASHFNGHFSSSRISRSKQLSARKGLFISVRHVVPHSKQAEDDLSL